MPTLTVEITDALNDRLEREVATSDCKDRNALVQSLLEAAMLARWREQMQSKIDESLADIERGDVFPWTPGDAARLGRQYLAEKRAKEGRS